MADESAVGGPATALSAEDSKLATLARGARGRVGAVEGAAVRDETGRTYSGATVALASLPLSALRLAVAQAAASGARGLEAAVVVRADAALDAVDVDAVRDLGGAGIPVIVVGTDSLVLSVVTT
jgi:hypothetical protein